MAKVTQKVEVTNFENDGENIEVWYLDADGDEVTDFIPTTKFEDHLKFEGKLNGVIDWHNGEAQQTEYSITTQEYWSNTKDEFIKEDLGEILAIRIAKQKELVDKFVNATTETLNKILTPYNNSKFNFYAS